MALPAEVAALVEQREAPCAFLVRFDFVSGVKRIWTGFGTLTTTDGQVWSGLGELGSIDGLSSALSGNAPAGRLVASGVDARLIQIASGETADFIGRPVSVFLQAFNILSIENAAVNTAPPVVGVVGGGTADIGDTLSATSGTWTTSTTTVAGRQPSGLPCPLALRIMTSLEVTRNDTTRTIVINHESPYIGRNRPAGGFYSDRDQQKRHPGDKFCERVPFLLFKTDVWPDY